MIDLIDAIGTATNLTVKPFDTDTVETCITYRYWQTSRYR